MYVARYREAHALSLFSHPPLFVYLFIYIFIYLFIFCFELAKLFLNESRMSIPSDHFWFSVALEGDNRR